ncbi:LysR family transcriptional regulator [Paenalcaligenes suwonensis]|uniref:LysR family transcriptional regulator n=1 Tax=Paenalcaligenes suwonensis TaxID=1202713 RepID=UPI001407C6D7|nr:LysR family transcriptional regulator [Paenalcaligenes suwonensis]NHC60813.1 LysR family transcriptional regulator [Paenalcaligenes suwonensis]
MNLRFLETFIWIAKLGSFKAAANKLHLTQAAISSRIASLESDLEQQLFERGKRGLLLTSAGQKLLGYSKQMLHLEQELLKELKAPVTVRGRVRLGIIDSVVHTWFTSFITTLHEHHPEIEIELTVESSMRLHDLLKRGLIDVALQTDPILAEGVHNAPVGTMKMGWIIAVSQLPPQPVKLADILQNSSIVTFPRHSQPHLLLLNILEQEGLQHTKIHHVSSIAASMYLLEAGIGVGAVPLAAYRSGFLEGRFCELKCDINLPDMSLVASWRPDVIASLTNTIVHAAMQEMRRFAELNPADSKASLDASVWLSN